MSYTISKIREYCPQLQQSAAKVEKGILLNGCQVYKKIQHIPHEEYSKFIKAITTDLSQLKKPFANQEMI